MFISEAIPFELEVDSKSGGGGNGVTVRICLWLSSGWAGCTKVTLTDETEQGFYDRNQGYEAIAEDT